MDFSPRSIYGQSRQVKHQVDFRLYQMKEKVLCLIKNFVELYVHKYINGIIVLSQLIQTYHSHFIYLSLIKDF